MIKNNSRKKQYFTIGLVILLLCSSYYGIYHSHRYVGFNLNIWICMAGALFTIALQEIWLKDSGKWHKFRTFLFIVFVAGPLYILVLFLHDRYMENQLTAGALKVNGVVQELFVRKGRHGRRTSYAVFIYRVNDRMFSQKIVNDIKPLRIGDTLRLRYAITDPEIVERIDDNALFQ